MPLRSATLATVAPGASASSMMRAFSSGGDCRCCSTTETTSNRFLSITVLIHVIGR